MAHIAWIGAGLLGAGFVEAALARGLGVTVWNRTVAKAKALEAHGARVASSLEEAVAGVERVHLCLSDDAAVDAVLDRIVPCLGPGVPVVCHTTVSPEGARARAARLAAKGIGFLACPVFMSPANARAATGRMLCAGPSALVASLAPELRAMTGELVVLGEDVTRPATLKLVGNTMIIGMAAALADAMTVAAGAGVPPSEVQAFVATFPFAALISGRGAKMAEGDFTPSFELAMARKDVRLMLEAAGARPVAALGGIATRMDALIGEGFAESDFGVLAKDALPEHFSK
jgi:3-hydroxyisobutyrate dehydrogenase-like beta-hydroxyacid dehydrogenase